MMVQYNASFFSLTLSAPIISYMNEDLGPKDHYSWMAIVWPLAFSATMAVNGRLGDLFGRRWLIIKGEYSLLLFWPLALMVSPELSSKLRVPVAVKLFLGSTDRKLHLLLLAVGFLEGLLVFP
jgi:MFS family permease